jgi:hypothetical protein
MTTDDALAALRAEFANWPEDWHVTEMEASRSWGTYGPNNERKEGVGAWRETWDDGWMVTVETDGWEKENRRLFHWGKSIAEAAVALRDEMVQRRVNPHYFHIEEGWVMARCQDCADDVVNYMPELIGIPRPIDIRS